MSQNPAGILILQNTGWIDLQQSEKIYNITIIGAGPAGLAAACRCAELQLEDVLLIERDSYPGGILPQCIHGGFGLKIFNTELTGPQYCQIFTDKLEKTDVCLKLDTMALSIESGPGLPYKEVTVASRQGGFESIKTRALILALGCRERTRGQLMIPGSRPAGVYTAGLVQRMVNIEGFLPGREIVILGSGDIGLIMARRLSLEGCKVKGVFELMPFSTGLLRNISQCLEDFNIELHLSHTVTNIYGDKRLEAIEVCRVNEGLAPIRSSARKIKCDTLLLSVGLIPENELSKTCGIDMDPCTGGPKVDENLQTSREGIFSCGNSLFVYDLVDNVTTDGYMAAESAVAYISGNQNKSNISATGKVPPERACVEILPGENVLHVVPQLIKSAKDIVFNIRARIPLRNAVLEFLPGSFSKRIHYVNPGEMIAAKLSKQQMEEMIAKNLNSKGPVKVNLKRGGLS